MWSLGIIFIYQDVLEPVLVVYIDYDLYSESVFILECIYVVGI